MGEEEKERPQDRKQGEWGARAHSGGINLFRSPSLKEKVQMNEQEASGGGTGRKETRTLEAQTSIFKRSPTLI